MERVDHAAHGICHQDYLRPSRRFGSSHRAMLHSLWRPRQCAYRGSKDVEQGRPDCSAVSFCWLGTGPQLASRHEDFDQYACGALQLAIISGCGLMSHELPGTIGTQISGNPIAQPGSAGDNHGKFPCCHYHTGCAKQPECYSPFSRLDHLVPPLVSSSEATLSTAGVPFHPPSQSAKFVLGKIGNKMGHVSVMLPLKKTSLV